MTYDQLQTYLNLCYYIYLPILALILIIIFILLVRSQLKKMRTEPFKKSLLGLTPERRHTSILIFKLVPVTILFGVLTLPFFYLVFQDRQYEYCKNIISINNITNPQDKFFKNKCSFFAPEEFFHNQ